MPSQEGLIEAQMQYLRRFLPSEPSPAAPSIPPEDISKREISRETVFLQSLARYVEEKSFLEGEHLLFREIHRNPSPENLRIALNFYEILRTMPPKALRETGFSPLKISAGLGDLQYYYDPKRMADDVRRNEIRQAHQNSITVEQ